MHLLDYVAAHAEVSQRSFGFKTYYPFAAGLSGESQA
jgi:hypothetical protein